MAIHSASVRRKTLCYALALSHIALAFMLGLTAAAGCGGGDNNKGNTTTRPQNTGAACMVVDDCYPKIDSTKLKGAPVCLAEARDGYCTHMCTVTEDCCAVTGECGANLHEVCAPFTSNPGMMCFVSCESADLLDANGTPDSNADPNEFCQREASPDFTCRASGGGDPRKICFPEACDVGANCAADADCPTGMVCLTNFSHGYCSVRDCTVNADCPNPDTSSCVRGSNGATYCLRKCTADSDCGFCRAAGEATTCSATVEFVEAGTTGSVCVP